MDKDGKQITLKDGTVAISQRNDSIGDVAKDSGGAFVIASNGKDDIERLSSLIKSKYKDKKQGAVKINDRAEYFYYPLGLSLLFLLIGFSSIPRREV